MGKIASNKELVEKIRDNGDIFSRVAGFSPELIDFRPQLEDAWTIRENLAHLLDSEMSLFMRIRQAVSNPGSDLAQAYSLEDWKDRFDHTKQSMAETVELYKKVHALACEVLAGLEDRDWSTFFINHIERGKQTLHDSARIISIHGGFHLELVERNEALWNEQK